MSKVQSLRESPIKPNEDGTPRYPGQYIISQEDADRISNFDPQFETDDIYPEYVKEEYQDTEWVVANMQSSKENNQENVFTKGKVVGLIAIAGIVQGISGKDFINQRKENFSERMLSLGVGILAAAATIPTFVIGGILDGIKNLVIDPIVTRSKLNARGYKEDSADVQQLSADVWETVTVSDG